MAFFTTSATVLTVIPFVLQYSLSNQFSKRFAPLLALQEVQQRAILFDPLILISFIICSQVGLVFLDL